MIQEECQVKYNWKLMVQNVYKRYVCTGCTDIMFRLERRKQARARIDLKPTVFPRYLFEHQTALPCQNHRGSVQCATVCAMCQRNSKKGLMNNWPRNFSSFHDL